MLEVSYFISGFWWWISGLRDQVSRFPVFRCQGQTVGELLGCPHFVRTTILVAVEGVLKSNLVEALFGGSLRSGW